MNRTYTNVKLSDDLDPIVQHGKQYVQACFYRAINHIKNPEIGTKLKENSLEKIFANFLMSKIVSPGAATLPLNSRLRSNIISRSNISNIVELTNRGSAFAQTLKAKPQLYGELSKLDWNSKESFGAQIGNTLFNDLKKLAPNFNTNVINFAKESRKTTDPVKKQALMLNFLRTNVDFGMVIDAAQESTTTPPDSVSTRGATELRLNLVKVKCIDEMDWEWTDYGPDNISMGGKAFCHDGTEINVGEFHVSNFDQGDVFTFGGTPRRFASFDLTKSGVWPRAYSAVLAMAEKDADGGFIDVLRQIWDAIDEVVIKALADVLTKALKDAAITGASAAAVGLLSGPEGAIMAAIVGALVGFAVSLVMESLKDDVFEPVMATPVLLLSPTEGFDGKGGRVTQTFSTEINRDGARYRVWFNWTLHG